MRKGKQKEEKGQEQTPKRRITAKDVVVIVLALIALVGLLGIIVVSNMDARRMQNDLAGARQSFADQRQASSQTSASSVCLNEVNASGQLEYYNENQYPVDLKGYTVALNGQSVWTFQDGDVMEPGAFKTVDISASAFDADRQNVVALCNAEGTVLTQLLTPALKGTESYARTTDGGQEFGYFTATMGVSNEGADPVAARQGVVFSRPGGFYNTEFLLQLTAPEGCKIYYTTDGTAPTTASSVYADSLSIQNKSGSTFQYADVQGLSYPYYFPETVQKGTVIKAVAVDDNGVMSDVATQTYFISLGQHPAFSNHPALSIVADPESLFGYFDGIYVPGRLYEDDLLKGGTGVETANYMGNWTRKGWVEFYEADKDKTYQGDIDLGIVKDSGVTEAQKSFHVGTMDGTVSEGSSLYGFLSGGTGSFALDAGRYDQNYKIREAVAYSLLEDSSVGTPQLTPCNVFLNGEYWGVYMLRQPYDANYIHQTYGVDQDNVVLASGGMVNDGADDDQALYNELLNFVRNNNLSRDENYDALNAMMDMDSYLDYFCANMYLSNTEYRWSDSVMWRSRTADADGYLDGRWRWLMPQLDGAMDNGMTGKPNTSSGNTFLRAKASGDELIVNLLASEQFRQELTKKIFLMENEVFTPERVDEALTKVRDSMGQMALNSYTRFNRLVADTVVDDEIQKISDFFAGRGYYMEVYTQELASSGILGPEEDAEPANAQAEDTASKPANSQVNAAGQENGQANGAPT